MRYRRYSAHSRHCCCCYSKTVIAVVASFMIAYVIFWVKMLQVSKARLDATAPVVMTSDSKVFDMARQNDTVPTRMDILSKHEHLLSMLEIAPTQHIPGRINTTQSALLHLKPTIPQKAVLLTRHARVTASVRGSLGPPSVLTSPIVDNLLTDRWQAASDKQGTPVSGPHYVAFVLQKQAGRITRVVLDFCEAYADQYKVEVYCLRTKQWREIYNNILVNRTQSNILKVTTSMRHVVHTIDIVDGFSVLDLRSPAAGSNLCPVVSLRVAFRKPATKQGTCLWRVEAWGYRRLTD